VTERRVVVRPARRDELLAVGDLTADTYRADGLVGEAYAVVLRDAAARAADPQTEVLVAVDADASDTVLGAVAYTRPGSTFADVGGPGEAGIRMLVTSPAARGAGVGTRLVEACIESARRDRLDQIVLLTADPMTTAHRLYERLGFVTVPWRNRRLDSGATLRAYALRLAPVRVRRAAAADFAEIGRLTLAAYVHGGLLMDPTDPAADEDTREYAAALRDVESRTTGGELLVAESAGHPDLPDGTIVGTVTYTPYGSELSEIAEPGEAEFRMLAVDPALPGTGAGAALVHVVLDRARQDSAAAVVLSTQDEAVAARRLYDRLGFERLPDRDWEPVRGLQLRVLRRAL
jgi:ribosomal protein S18 acetylase RimI-like enzyme